MKIDNPKQDVQILKELGRRLSERRKESTLTQAMLAEKSGVSKRTIERLEAGLSIQMSTLLKILRVLNMLNLLNDLIPVEVTKKPNVISQVKIAEAKEPLNKSRSWGAEG